LSFSHFSLVWWFWGGFCPPPSPPLPPPAFLRYVCLGRIGPLCRVRPGPPSELPLPAPELSFFCTLSFPFPSNLNSQTCYAATLDSILLVPLQRYPLFCSFFAPFCTPACVGFSLLPIRGDPSIFAHLSEGSGSMWSAVFLSRTTGDPQARRVFRR